LAIETDSTARRGFYAAAKSAGIRQIVGAELTLDDESRFYVLAPDRKCYQNLCRMITDSKMRVLNPARSHATAL